jgi:hypothetical protein
LLLPHERLGNVGNAQHFIGLVSLASELHSVACFGYGSAGKIRDLIGTPAFCLERGCCVPHAPPNAASFLINNACKLVHSLTGTAVFATTGHLISALANHVSWRAIAAHHDNNAVAGRHTAAHVRRISPN